MSNSTIQLARSIAFAQAFNQLRPLTGVGANSSYPNEPALSIGDWVRQAILSPPFAWRWNRSTASTSINSTAQDYSIALPTFGWLETATINNTSTGFNKELEIRGTLTLDSTQNEPVYIAVQNDDGNGNITFRVFPNPDTTYTLNLVYQNAPPVFSQVTDTWAPIPDYMNSIYNQGFLAKAYEQRGDEKFAFAIDLFFRQLIAVSEGLTEDEKNIFLERQIITQRQLRSVGGPINPAGIINQK